MTTRTATELSCMSLFDLQRDFMEACSQTISPKPGLNDETKMWERLIWEEVNELDLAARKFHQSYSADHLAEVMHEALDIIYVTAGLLNNLGVGHLAIAGFHRIHLANMQKVDAATGVVRRRDDGKILKPDNWQPAKLLPLLLP